jgi:glycosyltransferase involved in cell wall biosynthesis
MVCRGAASRMTSRKALTRVLVFSTLYPNAAQPNHGVFVDNRLRETLALGGLDATVIAPVPYLPFPQRVFGAYSTFARVPRHERRRELDVWHPRYLVVPKIGSLWTPEFLYRSALACVRRLQRQGMTFDVIDAHYFYPDGVAAARLGRTLGIPVVITGRGTDLTLIPEAAPTRKLVVEAAAEAAAMVTVCEDLRRRLIALGAPADRVLTLRNGVDLDLFSPKDRAAARAKHRLDGFVLLSVGGLIERKGHHLAIEALATYPDCTLVIAGGGPLRAELEQLAARLGVADRVRFLGDTPHSRLPELYSAADALVLASSREGWANVLLEAMACGLPVLATDVNGTAEAVQSPAAGLLLPERTAACLTTMIGRLRADLPRREDTRRYAEQFGWGPIARANKALLTAVAAAGPGRREADVLAGARRALSATE